MKSDYHRGTILLTNGIHNNIQLHEKPRHHISSVSVIDTKSTATLLASSGSSSGKAVVGYSNGSQVKGSGNMSVHEDPRITHKVNLAAAFHDHISCTKLPSQISKNGGDISSLIGASLNNGSCIDTNNSLFGAAAGSSNEDKIQIKKLKEMILMQLDLIQHQQEQLLKKERQLQGLKHDRETLCLKIDKMENRITFLTRKLLEANSIETASPGINDNNTHPESINELNAQSSDSEVMISCMNDTNDVSNMFTTVHSTPSPPSTSNPTIVSPRTNSNQPVASSNQSLQATCGTQTISSGDIEEVSDKSKSKSSNHSGEKKVKVNSVKTEIKKEDANATEKKNNSKETKKSATKRKRPSTSSTTSSTLPATTITTSTVANSVTTSTPLTATTTTTSSKNVLPQSNKDDLPVSTDKPVNSESSNEEISSSQSSSSSKKRRRTVSKSGSSATSSDQQQTVNNVNCKSISTNVNVLETDEPYDLYNCREEKSVIQRMEAAARDTLITINQVEVPSWRIINVPDSNSTDGIENLDDDTYLKRHQKLENDERRRKRWDIQRLREQKLNEKLRSGRYYYSAVNFDKPPCTAGQSKQITLDLISFFQDPKEVQFIEVSDKIPVMAFGHPIPKLPPKPFTLPWLKSSRQP